MNICVICKNLILGEEFFLSSIFSSEEQGSCCSECYEEYGEMEKNILREELGEDSVNPNNKNSDFKTSNANEDLKDEMEMIIDKNKQLIFFKNGDRPLMSIYGSYESFLEGLDTNFPIINVYGNNLDGNYTSKGLWMITYDKQMDFKLGKIWVESNQIDDSDFPF
mgnify:CR=1 FL=1|tara:strand:+ start:2745 stop:3239 length:495 start_codon:yes stop_codon:yes gene_type:complete